MKKYLAILAVTAAALIMSANAEPLAVQPVVTPPQPVRIAPLILSPDEAVATIARIKADGNTVLLSGSTVAVNPPYGMLVTSGTNAGRIAVLISLKAATR